MNAATRPAPNGTTPTDPANRGGHRGNKMSENHNRACSRALRPIHFAVLGSLALGTAVALHAGSAHAQVINQNEGAALPAGTNVLLGYYEHDELDNLNLGRGRGTLTKNTHVSVDLGVARYVHFFEVGKFLSVVQIVQPFGEESNFQVAGRGMRGTGVQLADMTLGYTIWPYIDAGRKTALSTSVFLNVPDGDYVKSNPINLGTNRISGDYQILLNQGLGTRFSLDVAVDAEVYGDNTGYTPRNLTLSANPSYRVQTFFNYNIQRGMTVGVGYLGQWGGRESVQGNFDGAKTEVSQVRFDASTFLSPSSQILIELNHDIHVVGGFQQEIGAELRLLKVF